MSERIYTVIFDQVSVSAAQDLFSVKNTASVPCKIIAVFLAQSNKSQDANDFQVRWRIRRGQTAQGSGGTTPTASSGSPGDSAAGGTVHVNDTTQANTGTIITLHNDVFNNRAGLVWIPTPDMQFLWAVSTCLTVELPAAPSSALTMNGALYYAEMI